MEYASHSPPDARPAVRLASLDPESRLQFSTPLDPDREPNFDGFPASPAVFAIFPAGASGLAAPYLSQARDLERRLRRLLGPREGRRLNLRNSARRIDYQPVGSNFEAQWLLYQLNHFYYPDNFHRRLRLRPPAMVKIKLHNRFPRCYPTRLMTADGSLYYGPFPTRAAAERFTSDFLDLFKIRRCTPDLHPDPSHPGCIYSQMNMCLAPCFQGCTDEEYREETQRVIAFLDSGGETLVHDLDAGRSRASENLEFEQAARAHRKLEKAQEVIRARPALVRPVLQLDAVMVLPSSEDKTVTFFRIAGGEIRGPAPLSLAENVSSPISLDQRLQALLESLGGPPGSPGARTAHRDSQKSASPSLPPWEHLSLLARWYYSSFRVGELLQTSGAQPVPHSRLIRLCRKVLEGKPASRSQS